MLKGTSDTASKSGAIKPGDLAKKAPTSASATTDASKALAAAGPANSDAEMENALKIDTNQLAAGITEVKSTGDVILRGVDQRGKADLAGAGKKERSEGLTMNTVGTNM